MIDDESEIAKSFNEYFVNIVKKLGILTEEQTMYSAASDVSRVFLGRSVHTTNRC